MELRAFLRGRMPRLRAVSGSSERVRHSLAKTSGTMRFMAAPRDVPNSIVTVKTHHTLRAVAEDAFAEHSDRILREADAGVQTIVLGSDGKSVRAVIGMNGHRFFQDPDPDPLDEIEQLACGPSVDPEQ